MVHQFKTQLFGDSNFISCENKRLFYTKNLLSYFPLTEQLKKEKKIILKFHVLSSSEKCFNSIGISNFQAFCI